jgi:hypothetical protein
MKRLSLALLLLVLSVWPVWAQPVTVIGPITPGDCAYFSSVTILKDAGFSCNGGTSGFLTGGGAANYVPVFTGTTTLSNGFYLLPAGAQLYASATGTDTNNTCSNSGSPCTLKGACLMRSGLATFLQAINGSLTINVNGTAGHFTALDGNGAQCSIEGNSGGSSSILTSIMGSNGATLDVPNGATGIFTKDLGEVEINGITITGGIGSIGVSGGQYSVVDELGITWGSWGASGIHLNFSGNSTLNISGETLNNNIATHINIDSARVTASAGSVNIPSGIAFSNAFMNSNGNAQINWNAGAVTGAGVAGTTGRRAFLIGPGWMATGGTPCNTVFPGSVVCSIRFGFMDDANDLQTTQEMLNSSMPTATRNGDIAYWNSGAASWWQTLAGNNSGTQVLSENSSGTPAWLASSTTVDGQSCVLGSTCQTAIAGQSDYVATTWTPAITTDATVGTPAYTTQLGTYEQLGRQITVRFNITLSGWTGSPTGNVGIAGLPVANVGNYGTCVVSFYSGVNLTGAVNGITGLIPDTLSTVSLYQSGSTTSTKVVALTNIGTTATLVGWCNYHK